MSLSALVLAALVATSPGPGNTHIPTITTPSPLIALATNISKLSASDRAKIAAAFAHLLPTGASLRSSSRYVQDGDGALASDLQQAASNLVAGYSNGPDIVSVRMASLASSGPTSAIVDFDVTVHGHPSGSFVERYSGDAVAQGGTWLVSWSTACFLIESQNELCPNSPVGLTTPLPLPSELSEPSSGTPDPGLVDPEALAVEPDGSLLIVDQSRDQILRRLPDGRLGVVAGTGAVGYSGDGGPATKAELDHPSGLAVEPNGTIYVADTNDHRVRAISPSGTITTVAGNGTAGDAGDGVTAVRGELEQPDGLALAPDGTLYIADGTDVREVSPTGLITTFVRPSGRYDDVTVGGESFNFEPQWVALDASGDLFIFSGSVKELIEASPSGKLLRAWQYYANAMATAPDGSVIIAEHGAALQRITAGARSTVVNFITTKMAGFGTPGIAGPFEPQGVAVGRDGEIYTDTAVGNGYTTQTALAEVSPEGKAQLLRTSSTLASTLPAAGTPGFPSADYPEPVASRGGMNECPSPSGLRPFDAGARAQAVREAKVLDTGFWTNIRLSDRAWWPGVYADAVDGFYDPGAHRVVSVGAATDDLYAAAVAQSCGEALVRGSLAIVVGPSGYSSQVSHLYFVDRNGRALLYWQHT
jgi:sugar lactone lactonase YvrE